MQANTFQCFSLYLIVLLIPFTPSIDTAELVTSDPPDQQLCSKIQLMLSSGKYYTHQMSSNVTYVSRVYPQTFLAYSPLDDLLIFLEPKNQLHVYHAHSVHLIVNITTENVSYAISYLSMSNNDQYELFFIYESRPKLNLVSIRVCEMSFNLMTLAFEEKNCIQTLTIHSDKPEIRINGFTIKHNHAKSKKSLIFVSTNIGLVFTVFDIRNRSLVRQPIILNDTLNEGSVVVTASGMVYYTNKQENTIHELYITRDFRIRYGKMIKSNAIRSPFGLIADECDHLYIATRSMILVMFVKTYKTIRSVFSKASDLPITIERLNSTTYAYATIKQSSGKLPPTWMFNFLSFTDPEKTTVITRSTGINKVEKLTSKNEQSMTTIFPVSSSYTSIAATDTMQPFVYFPSTPEVSEPTHTFHTIEETLITEFTDNPSTKNLQSDTTLSANEVDSTAQVSDGYDQFSTATSIIPSSEVTLLPNRIETTQNDFISSVLVEGNVFPTLSPLLSSTILTPSLSSQTFPSLHSLLEHLITASDRLPSSEHLSGTMSTPSPTLPSLIGILETTDLPFTSDITEQSSIATQPDESSSSLLTMESGETSTSSTLLSTATPDQLTTDTFSTTLDTTIQLDQTSTVFVSKPYDKQTDITSLIQDTSTLAVTQSFSPSKRFTRRRTSTTSTSTSTRTEVYRTRRRSRLPTTKTTISSSQLTSVFTVVSTSPTTPRWYPPWNLRSQDTRVIRPSVNDNSSHTLLSNDLFNTLFNTTTNSSKDKHIYFNLNDLPPSNWYLSLNTTESVLLDILLPAPSDLGLTTNLTISNVESTRFSTNIVGSPINLQVDQIQTKQFSLSLNLTNNQANGSVSEVVIGHIRTDQFALNITKSDDMNVNVQQVDTETAEIFLDEQFCSSGTNFQLNLNLGKNGTIRFGNRPPVRIGPVFTRMHMLKQSCDLDQPFALFFDICGGQNPCLNGGTCQSQIPNYDDPSYSKGQSSEINYQCICPENIFGDHCQLSLVRFGYCLNGGTLMETFDVMNESVEICLCPPGFQGEHCEENIDDCANIFCSQHGLCHDGINKYTCSCFDGFFGAQCEEKTLETALLQAASKSFATVAILLISAIAGLVVASDIHTHVTKRTESTQYRLNKLPRTTSELVENSMLLLGFGDAPMETTGLSTINTQRRRPTAKNIGTRRAISASKQSSHQHLLKTKYIKTLRQTSRTRQPLSNSTS